MLIRDLAPADLGAVLEMNNAAVPAVNPHDAGSLEVLLEMADRSWVVADGDALGGLLVTFAPGTAYSSANYRWLSRRFDDFRYVDRVVVAPVTSAGASVAASTRSSRPTPASSVRHASCAK